MGTSVAVMAGGTGGHVFPALAVARLLRDQGMDVFWIGTKRGMESRLVPEHGFPMEWISIEGLRGKGVRQVLTAPWKLLVALRQAERDPAPAPPEPGSGDGRFRFRAWRTHGENSRPALGNPRAEPSSRAHEPVVVQGRCEGFRGLSGKLSG